MPTGTNDPMVSYDSAATQAALDTLINNTKLRKYRGQIAPRTSRATESFTRIDLHLEQEIPTFIGSSRIALFGDIENLPNLLNSDWGGAAPVRLPVHRVAGRGAVPDAAVADRRRRARRRRRRLLDLAAGVRAVPLLVVPRSGADRGDGQSRNSLYLIRVGARFTF